jgi:site-specific DNA-cytosine methylase
MKHASIIPLIGGITLGQEQAFGTKPSYLLSYTPFAGNDQHLVSYYKGEVPYINLDDGEMPSETVDVISSCCPCAGLSTLSHGYGDDNPNNEWMGKVAEYVLSTLRPRVYWGENAPGLMGKIGVNVRDNLIAIGLKNGYTVSFYRTKSLLHGIPQVRERSFYFFWKGDKTPVLNFYNRPFTPIQDVITGVKDIKSQAFVINPKKPSEDPFYRYLLEVVHSGITHREYYDKIDTSAVAVRSYDAQSVIEESGHDYLTVAKWMDDNGYERMARRCERIDLKLKSGHNVMRRGVMVPKGYIGAFVGHYPVSLTHPYEDRFITYREAMAIMAMPDDFELIDPKKNTNHICQNVPVTTARDMAFEVLSVLNGDRRYVDSSVLFQYNNTSTNKSIKGSTLDKFLIEETTACR